MEIPAGFAQVNFLFTGPGVPTGAEVTMGFSVPLEDPTPDEMANAVLLGWSFAPVQNSSVSLTGVRVKYGPALTGPSTEIVANVPGTRNLASLPPNCAALIRKATGLGGRSGRGRFFLPGIEETQTSEGGVLSPIYRADIQAAADDTHEAWVTAGYIPTLLHSAGAPIAQPLPIVAFNVGNRVATQRRRLRR